MKLFTGAYEQIIEAIQKEKDFDFGNLHETTFLSTNDDKVVKDYRTFIEIDIDNIPDNELIVIPLNKDNTSYGLTYNKFKEKEIEK